MNIIKSIDRQTKVISLAAALCLLVAIIMSADTFKFYTQKKATVSASVSKMEMYDESTEDRNEQGYRIYVNYVCMGKTFHDAFYKNVELDTDIQVGDRIEIEVYAEKPDEIVRNVSVNFLFFFAAFIVLGFISAKKIKADIRITKSEN